MSLDCHHCYHLQPGHEALNPKMRVVKWAPSCLFSGPFQLWRPPEGSVDVIFSESGTIHVRVGSLWVRSTHIKDCCEVYWVWEDGNEVNVGLCCWQMLSDDVLAGFFFFLFFLQASSSVRWFSPVIAILYHWAQAAKCWHKC